MTEDTRAERPATEVRRPGDLLAELTSLLQSADRPLTLGDLSLGLGRNFRAVAWVLAAACQAGTVDRLEGGRYALAMSPALVELLAFVRACETRWELNAPLRAQHSVG